MKTFSIELPFFCGFYESPFYNSDSEYYAIREDIDYLKEQYGEDKTTDDFQVNWDEYTGDVCDAFVEAFKANAPDFVQDAVMDEMVSPKYYNFSTDRLFANVTLEDSWRQDMLDFMETNKEWFDQKLKDNFTSYDGFISFMENDHQSWVDEISKETPDERYIGSLIGFMMLKKCPHIREYMIEDTLEDIYLGSYLECIKDDSETA